MLMMLMVMEYQRVMFFFSLRCVALSTEMIKSFLPECYFDGNASRPLYFD